MAKIDKFLNWVFVGVLAAICVASLVAAVFYGATHQLLVSAASAMIALTLAYDTRTESKQ